MQGGRSGHLSGIGFTLIELMIALAIVAITASYAVPAYQTTIARSRVGEGLALAATARMAVSENVALGLPFQTGYVAPAATQNVQSIAVSAANGEITISYTPRVAAAAGNRLLLVPSAFSEAGERIALDPATLADGNLRWECFAAGKTASREEGPLPAGVATLPAKLALAECRG